MVLRVNIEGGQKGDQIKEEEGREAMDLPGGNSGLTECWMLNELDVSPEDEELKLRW